MIKTGLYKTYSVNNTIRPGYNEMNNAKIGAKIATRIINNNWLKRAKNKVDIVIMKKKQISANTKIYYIHK